jgi:hypothetical protein
MHIKNEFVPYKESLELKKLGFNEACIAIYLKDGGLNGFERSEVLVSDKFKISLECCVYYVNDTDIKDEFSNLVAAPLFSTVFEWFRKNYLIDNTIVCKNNGEYSIIIIKRGKEIKIKKNYTDYNNARIDCLRELLKQII